MAISRETIEKKSFIYSLLRPYVNKVTKTYFRTTVYNYENVPKNDIIIYAPNHQNALMDALAILATIKTEPVFLARADIFKKKTIEKLLTLFKILPIYRIRDGKESLGNNEAVFQKTIDVLKNKNGLVILPEGYHAGFRKLKTLKKGISRIAFEAEESNDFKLNIKIIPVGLDWSNYINFRSKLFIYFGEPISVSDYYDEYKKNPPRALNKLREKLSEELKKYMIHIGNDEYYEMFDNIRYIFLPEMIKKMGFKNRKQPNQLFAEQNIIKQLNEFVDSNPNEAKELNDKTLRYSELLKKLHFRNRVIQKGKFSNISLIGQALLAVLFLPLYLLGGILNYLPYKIPVWATKKVKDPQFLSSFRSVIALLLFPVYYIILITTGLLLLNQWWHTIALIILLPFAGLFAFHYYIEFKKMLSGIRYNLKTLFKNKDLIELTSTYNYILGKMDGITK
ncbi:MAG: 1-acyl-sn-glycerol-3-phosphate acyltransferase [Bacteroidales bacterium]|nr:1-acyl-sn-glycerol-3-phosphate acyltransferase [Bacteroidales bacterium]